MCYNAYHYSFCDSVVIIQRGDRIHFDYISSVANCLVIVTVAFIILFFIKSFFLIEATCEKN